MACEITVAHAGPLHAHAENGDGQQIERNVQQGGENEKIDRGPGVSERADDAGDDYKG